MINYWIELQLMLVTSLMVGHFVAILNNRAKRTR